MDNTTPLDAKEYDKKINNTLPYYNEFYLQTIDIIRQYERDKKDLDWIDLGCGTGTLEDYAIREFPDTKFILADPSEKMLEQARIKLGDKVAKYICTDSASIEYDNCFDVVTAIQSHHYMKKEERIKATECILKALRVGGIYISFENVIPKDDEIKMFELKRWGQYQQRHGKTEQEANEHNARCGVNYFPITIEEHIKILENAGFSKVQIFWFSYMQMGIYGIK